MRGGGSGLRKCLAPDQSSMCDVLLLPLLEQAEKHSKLRLEHRALRPQIVDTEVQYDNPARGAAQQLTDLDRRRPVPLRAVRARAGGEGGGDRPTAQSCLAAVLQRQIP